MTAPERYDAVVVGSGFGGAMAAHALVSAGLRVAMLERGGWVPRSERNWDANTARALTVRYGHGARYRVTGDDRFTAGAFQCVGGPSVFYGAVALRFRESDFEPEPSIAGDSGARWPLDYATLEPWYGAAERLLGIAGEAGSDPTEPWRSTPFPQPLPALSPASRMIAAAAERLGMRPFRLPLAIDYAGTGGRDPCRACNSCDGFACGIGAKNDVSSTLIPALVARGLVLRPETTAVELVRAGRRIRGVVAVERASGRHIFLEADAVLLAAGALETPRLLLASGVAATSPAADHVGRYLMRHCNGIVVGLFPSSLAPDGEFTKQLGIHDFYHGDAGAACAGKLGGIQQVQSGPTALAQMPLPRWLRRYAEPAMGHFSGLLLVAEDQPRRENRVRLHPTRVAGDGLPELWIHHRYTPRDLAARAALAARARRLFREAGALAHYFHRIRTFSHALGTVRMGDDSATAPLDAACRFRGLDNLWVVDGSALPSAAGVNPSLTIAANALRAGAAIVGLSAERLAPSRARPLVRIEPWRKAGPRAARRSARVGEAP